MELRPFRARKQRRLAAMDAFRSARRLLDEDISVLGDQLAQVQAETVGSDPGWAVREDYQAAVACHEQSMAMRGQAETGEDVDAIDTVLTDGRFHLACVLARRDGTALPTRRTSCFFNPQHGPAATDRAWTPQGGVERQIEVCRLDADRLTAGEAPDVRMVRVGDRYVPWHAAGGSIATVVRHHEHASGGTTARTDKHVAEGRARGELANAPWTKI